MAASCCSLVRLQVTGCLSARNGLLASTQRLLSTAGGDGGPTKFQPPPKPIVVDKRKSEEPQRKYLSPEFIPRRSRKNPFVHYVERKDMIERRKAFNIPEFYPGSILAVNMADPYANGKTNRFVGICTCQTGKGLGATFVLRNIIAGQGVEIRYDLYSPRIQSVEVLKLEKRIDEDLTYLRDALPEYSTFDVDMKPEFLSANAEIPVNPIKVKMKPRPWLKHWERPKFNIKGIQFDLYLTEEEMEEARKTGRPWEEFDLLREYDTTELEEKIWKEVNEGLKK